MSEDPYGITIFCDDIREEVNGKLSLIGCYGNEISVFGIAPALLPMFCAFVNFRGPANLKYDEISVVITTEFGDQTTELGRVSFPRNGKDESDISENQILGLAIPFKFSPLIVPSEGFIRSRAYVDHREVKLGSIAVLLRDPIANPPEST
jgi:hypothetical protein